MTRDYEELFKPLDQCTDHLLQADAGHRTEKMVTERYSAMRERRRYALASAMDTMLTERKLPVQSSSTR